jgi:glutaredoxin 2
MINNLIGEHAIPVLRKDDYRVTPESYQFLKNIGKSMKERGQEILDRTEKLTVISSTE